MEILVWFALGFGVVGVGLGFFSLWVIYRVQRNMMDLLAELIDEDYGDEFDEMNEYEHEVYVN